MRQGTYADEVWFELFVSGTVLGNTSISAINTAEGKQRTLLLLLLLLLLSSRYYHHVIIIIIIIIADWDIIDRMLLSLSWSGLNSKFLFTLNIFSVHLLLTALMAVKVSIIQWLKYFIRQPKLSSMTYD